MGIILILMKRNMLLFFKDKTAVFFSFMAVFVVLFLYICFLGDMMILPLKKAFPNTAREISDTWIMAGTLGIVSLSSALSVLGIVIEDKSNKIIHDLYVTPASKMQIDIGYIASTITITLIISLVTLVIAQLYIIGYGGQWFSYMTILRIIFIMLVAIFSSTSILYYLMSFFQSASSFSNVTTIIGTLSGFLMGIYVPIGSLPNFLQTIISYFPFSHSAALFRQVMMEDVLRRSIPSTQSMVLSSFKTQFGLTFTYGDHVSNELESILVLIVVCLLFLILQKLRRKRCH